MKNIDKIKPTEGKGIKELIADLKEKCPDGYGVQEYFEPENEGGCPCFEGKVKLKEGTLHVWGRCWRVSENQQDLHVWGTLKRPQLEKVGKVVKRLLDKQKWYSSYKLIYGK